MSTRKSIEIIPGSKEGFSYTYITSDNNYTYHSNTHTNSVVCYDFNGVKKWCYRNDLLKEPKGITVDSNSNIYVAGSKSNNVVVISPDGKRAKQSDRLLVLDDIILPVVSVTITRSIPLLIDC
jgi:DNA-binding beta-propeller fold protein YncE